MTWQEKLTSLGWPIGTKCTLLIGITAWPKAGYHCANNAVIYFPLSSTDILQLSTSITGLGTGFQALLAICKFCTLDMVMFYFCPAIMVNVQLWFLTHQSVWSVGRPSTAPIYACIWYAFGGVRANVSSQKSITPTCTSCLGIRGHISYMDLDNW